MLEARLVLGKLDMISAPPVSDLVSSCLLDQGQNVPLHWTWFMNKDTDRENGAILRRLRREMDLIILAHLRSRSGRLLKADTCCTWRRRQCDSLDNRLIDLPLNPATTLTITCLGATVLVSCLSCFSKLNLIALWYSIFAFHCSRLQRQESLEHCESGLFHPYRDSLVFSLLS